jgi:endonuclease III
MSTAFQTPTSADQEGLLWPEESRAKYLEETNRILVSRYGLPKHGNKKDPLDEVIYIMLSSQTDESKYQSTYHNLETKYPSWNLIRPEELDHIEEILKPAGLSRVKAANLIHLLQKVEADFGTRNLTALEKMGDCEAEKYLCSLPGIGPKSARCVLMYSLNREVFPVDTHNFRVLQRLGAHNLPLPIRRWHNKLQNMIPASIRFSLHVTLILHGRDLCKASKPLCESCPLNQICCLGRSGMRKTS